MKYLPYFLSCFVPIFLQAQAIDLTYQVEHYDYFSFSKSTPSEKEWNFELNIQSTDQHTYTACYSQELTACLFNLHDFRKSQMSPGFGSSCFTYTLNEENAIVILDKTSILEQLNALKKAAFPQLKKKEVKALISSVDFLLEYEDELEKDLSRELTLIHELEGFSIPMNVTEILQEEEETMPVDLQSLEQDEIALLNKTNWEEMKSLDMYKTPKLNDTTYLFDYLTGIDLISSKQKADFSAIARDFLLPDFNINQYDQVTLNRDQRKLFIETNQLIFLLKERRTISDNMKKITHIKIEKG